MHPLQQEDIEAQRSRRSRGRPKLEDVAGIDSRLLDVALGEFLRQGFGGTTMTQIVRAAGVSKTTLYSRFPSKEALFGAIMRQQIERLAAGASLDFGAGPPQLARGLHDYAIRALDFSLGEEMLGVNRLVFGEAQRFPQLGALAAEATGLGIAQIARFIERCAEADGLPCREARAPAEVFIFMLRGWYVNVLLTGRIPSPDERESWVTRSVATLVAGRRDW